MGTDLLPDTRNLRFYQAEVTKQVVGSSTPVTIPISGWLTSNKRLVCWNGIEYSNIRLLHETDLKKHIEQLRSSQGGNQPYYCPSSYSDAANPFSLVGVALLIRANQVDLAELVYGEIVSSESDLSKELGVELAWRRYNHAIDWYIDGDMQQVILDCRWLMNAKQLQINRRTNNLPIDCDPNELLQEAMRRQSAPKRPPFNPTVVRGLPRAKRIEVICSYLDEVAARMEGLPSSMMWDFDPIYSEARSMGQTMIQPLLNVVNTRKQLSRTVWSQPNPKQKRILPVKEVAQTLVDQIRNDIRNKVDTSKRGQDAPVSR